MVCDESGIAAMEVGWIAARVAVGLIPSLTFLGDSLASTFDQVSSCLAGGSGAKPV